MSVFVGIDVGGTNMVCGLVNESGQLIAKRKESTEAQLGAPHVLDKIATVTRQLLTETGTDLSSVQAVGLGTPGIVDPVRGVTVFASNLQWTNVEVAKGLSSRLGVPAYIDNDVRMYVYGEAMQGAGKGYEHVLGITLGTGLAAAVVNHGKLYYGGGYMAGEIGHIQIEGLAYKCGCGGTGCLETAASASGIARQAKERLLQGRRSVLSEWFPEESLDKLTSADVSRAYDLGDPVAVEVMYETGRVLGKGLSYAVTLFSPDIIVIGGGGALAGERLWGPMREQLKKSLFRGYWERLTIAEAQMNDDAGIIGSALNAMRQLEHPLG